MEPAFPPISRCERARALITDEATVELTGARLTGAVFLDAQRRHPTDGPGAAQIGSGGCETGQVTDEHPELAGYEPYEEKPLHSKRVAWLLRVVVIAAIIGLVLPGLVTSVSVGTSNAMRACAYRVALVEPSLDSAARFELFGPGFLGWECYAVDPFSGDRHIDSMGLIPVAPRVSQVPSQGV